MKDKVLRYFLVGLAVLSVGFASFSNAEILGGFASTSYNGTHTFTNQEGYFTCVIATHSNCRIDPTQPNGDNVMYGNALYCFDSTFTVSCNNYYNAYEGFKIPKNMTKAECKSTYSLIESSECPVMTSLQCQTNYSLIPVSSVDQNYCTSNNLCPACEECDECPDSPIYTGDLTPGVSNIFINDVFHPGAFNVIMNIPEEIDWDYSYTSNGTNFNLDVVGYNQDTEYIEGLIDVQNYKPTSEDFSKVFLNFGNFGTLLIACLFVILVFYFVKKMFK